MWYTLDMIVRSLLLKQQKPFHWYIQYLVFACSGLQRLNNTTLRTVNTIKLTVNDYKAVTLPADYVDYIKVGFAIGERVRPLIYDENLNRLNNFAGDGTTKIPYEVAVETGDNLLTTLTNGDAYFNHDVSRDEYFFTVLRERGEIQLSAAFPCEEIILQYISDGLTADAATKVDPLAQACLEKWILWQNLVHNRNASNAERHEAERLFIEEWRLLRAAKSDLTKENIIYAIQSGYTGTYR